MPCLRASIEAIAITNERSEPSTKAVGLKAQVHAVMAEGGLPTVGDMLSRSDNAQLDRMRLGASYAAGVRSLRELIVVYDHQIDELEKVIMIIFHRWKLLSAGC